MERPRKNMNVLKGIRACDPKFELLRRPQVMKHRRVKWAGKYERCDA
jgi:hypothetical protein